MNHLAPRQTTLLVMHPDPLLRAGLASALREHSTFDTLVDGDHAALPDGRHIDVVITDHDNALQLARSLHSARRTLPAARILVLASNDREADIRRAFEAGIHGYMVLGSSVDELIEGATTVAKGLNYVSPAVAQRMADSLAHTSLTPREMEVLGLVVGGASNKAIARRLGIQPGTVKSHMTSIMAKLGASCRTQAAGIASTRGLVAHAHPARRNSDSDSRFSS